MKGTKEQNKKKMRVGAHDCTQRGITLIALVITIIVMLILVSVTINLAVNGGLFDYAGKAVSKIQDALSAEKELSNGRIQIGEKWYASIDDYVKGKAGVPVELKVGDYVNYTPTTGTYKVADGEYGSGYTTDEGYQEFTTETGENALKWRVLSIDETTGEIELVSATAAQTTAKLYLKGADGYNHGVDILNDLCETLYSNENGATARSINVEDINAKTTYDNTRYANSETGWKYGDTKQLSTYGTDYMNYPNLYSQEIGYGTTGTFNITGLSGSEGKNDGVIDATGVTTYSTLTGSTNGNTAGTDPYITYTYYRYIVEDYLNTNLGVNTAPEGLLKTDKGYWLASRCVGAGAEEAVFRIRCMVSEGYVYSGYMINCAGGSSDKGYLGVRPVVSLGANVTLTKDTENSTDEVTYWNIEYEL